MLFARAVPFVLLIATSAGCQFWPFHTPVRTSYVTPAKRIAAVEALGKQASGDDDAKQRQLTDELARQIQSERDPLVREAIIRAVADFETPMAAQILIAGLKDEDLFVRQTCCRLLGKRRDPSTVAALEDVVRSDEDLDVRIAATNSLGALGTPNAIPAISLALHDRDPALQFAGVRAMRVASGKDLGNDVAAWRDFAVQFRSPTPQPRLVQQAGGAGGANHPPGAAGSSKF